MLEPLYVLIEGSDELESLFTLPLSLEPTFVGMNPLYFYNEERAKFMARSLYSSGLAPIAFVIT
jgi:ABC-type molybdate transport system permease subunit